MANASTFSCKDWKIRKTYRLRKGFSENPKNNLRFQYTFQKVFKNLFIQNLPHGILFIPFRKSVQNSQQLSQTISINIVLALIHGCNKMLKEICALDNSNVSQNSIMHILMFFYFLILNYLRCRGLSFSKEFCPAENNKL